MPPRSRIRVVEVRNANRARLALVALAAAFVVLAVPTARAATKDVATLEVSPGPYLVGAPITFTSTTTCTVTCRLIWRAFRVGGPHLGEQLGEGEVVRPVFTTPGLKTVQLDLSEFCVGTSRLTCDSLAQITVNVDDVTPPIDTTPPTITATDLSAEATAPDTVVGYKVDATDPGTVISSSCSPASGEAFPVGATPIDCNAIDANGNVARAAFTVSVTDTTPPALTVPGTIAVEATSPAGAPVMYSAAASDLVDGSVTPSCTVPAGATFPLGSTMVACAATDAHHNSSNATFVVNVLAPSSPAPSAPAPVVVTVVDRTPPALSVPALLVVNATSPGGALVSYTATATDSTGIAVAPVCSRPSRTVFAAGTTTVTCTATDARGNTSPAQAFAVHVRGAGEQLVRVLQQARGWKSQALPGRVNQVIRVFAKGPARACGLLGVLDKDLRGSLGKGLTPAQRSTLHGDLGRIARAVGCARA